MGWSSLQRSGLREFKKIVGTGALVAGGLLVGSGTASAAIIDLTTAGASATETAAIGGTFFVQQVPDQSTGTGVIEPFLRIQANGAEQGYNTDEKVEYDTKAGTWTHALLLSDVPIVNLGGTDYYQFLLDINQNSGQENELLSLNQIQIFQAASDPGNDAETIDESNTVPLISFGAAATERFRLNNAGSLTNELLLNYELNSGSGSGDMFLYVRVDAFANTGGYVVFYSQFGTRARIGQLQ